MIFKHSWVWILYLLLSSLQDSKLEALYFIQTVQKGFQKKHVHSCIYIIALRHPHRHLFVIVPLENIIDVCVYMAFSDSEVHYAAHFPNHLEQDSDSKLLVNVAAVCWQGNGNAHDTCIE